MPSFPFFPFSYSAFSAFSAFSAVKVFSAFSKVETLHRIRQAGEVEVLRFDRRHDNRPARFGTAEPDRRPDRLDIIQQEQRRLIEPEILDRFRDLAVLDEKRAVACEARVEDCSWINLAQIP